MVSNNFKFIFNVLYRVGDDYDYSHLFNYNNNNFIIFKHTFMEPFNNKRKIVMMMIMVEIK